MVGVDISQHTLQHAEVSEQTIILIQIYFEKKKANTNI